MNAALWIKLEEHQPKSLQQIQPVTNVCFCCLSCQVPSHCPFLCILTSSNRIDFFPNSTSALCNNSQRSYLFSALGATLWRWGPSVCGGGWSIRTESGRSAESCSAPSASSPGPTRRRTTCRCVGERFPVKPTDPEPLSLVAPSTKLELCC